MSLHDVRCSVSRLSLLEAEAALFLLSRSPSEPHWRIASLPIWGRYGGTGTLESVTEGANAELILEAFVEASSSGLLQIDWNALGISPYALEHIEDVLTLFACASIHAPEAIRFGSEVLGFALVEAHFAATLMSREPVELDQNLQVEALPHEVFASSLFGKWLYTHRAGQSLKKKCQFGLSFLSLAGFGEALTAVSLEIQPVGPFFVPEPGQRERWFAEALTAFSEQEDLLEALRDYMVDEQEESEFETG